jgi:hypothetical protein
VLEYSKIIGNLPVNSDSHSAFTIDDPKTILKVSIPKLSVSLFTCNGISLLHFQGMTFLFYSLVKSGFWQPLVKGEQDMFKA